MIQIYNIKLEDHFMAKAVKDEAKKEGSFQDIESNISTAQGMYNRVNAYCIDTGEQIWDMHKGIFKKEDLELFLKAISYTKSHGMCNYVIVSTEGKYKTTDIEDPKYPDVLYFKDLVSARELKTNYPEPQPLTSLIASLNPDSVNEVELPYTKHTYQPILCVNEAEIEFLVSVNQCTKASGEFRARPWFITKGFKVTKELPELPEEIYALFLASKCKDLFALLGLPTNKKLTTVQVALLLKHTKHLLY